MEADRSAAASRYWIDHRLAGVCDYPVIRRHGPVWRRLALATGLLAIERALAKRKFFSFLFES